MAKYKFPSVEITPVSNGILVCTAKDIKSATTEQLLIFSTLEEVVDWLASFDELREGSDVPKS